MSEHPHHALRALAEGYAAEAARLEAYANSSEPSDFEASLAEGRAEALNQASREILSALTAQQTATAVSREEIVGALKPFAAVSAEAKGSDDACWCGQDGAVIRYRDLRRAAEVLSLLSGGEGLARAEAGR